MKLTRTIKTRGKKYLGTSKSFDSICSEINKNQFVKELKGREKALYLTPNSTGSSRLGYRHRGTGRILTTIISSIANCYKKSVLE